jgi:WD40 repeat protein
VALLRAFAQAAFTPDGRTIVSGNGSGRATLWQVATGQELLSFAAHGFPITTLAIAPNGRLIASGAGWRDENDGVNVWVARSP